MLELVNVSKTFGQTQVLAPTDLSVQPGRTTVLIGPSGCGKSTMLRLMIGLIEPDQGSVRFGDTELTPDNVTTLRHRMGYVLQDGGLFPAGWHWRDGAHKCVPLALPVLFLALLSGRPIPAARQSSASQRAAVGVALPQEVGQITPLGQY
jgi:ABC-type taurine transport system ATPase subunit